MQAMRGIAALLVVLFHLEAMFREGAPRSREFGQFWSRGFAGVDMFFVISGFIMVYVTRDIAPSLRNAGRFLWARLSRIYPLWWVFAGLMMMYFYVAYGQPAPPDKASGEDVLPYAFKSFALWPQKNYPVLGVGWTLIHEMMFYVLFALGLFLRRAFLPFWLVGWALLIVGRDIIWGPQPMHAGNLQELFLSPFNLEFIIGALIAIWILRIENRGTQAWFWVGLIFFALALLFQYPVDHERFVWMRVTLFGLPSALIILGLVSLERHRGLVVPSALVKLGNWSYSLYLSHMLVLLTVKRLWRMDVIGSRLPESLKWGAQGWLDNLAFIVIALIATIVTAWASYHLIERTSLRLLRGKAD